MKCESGKNKILLAHSGELSWLGRLSLARHLRGCPDCRRFKAILQHTSDAFQTAGDVPAVSPAVLEQIRNTARRENSRSELIHIRPSREPLLISLRPALLYSALGILLLTGFWLTIRPNLNQPHGSAIQAVVAADWDTAGIDTQIEDLSARLDLATADDDMPAVENEDVNSIARELLELEGQQI